MYNPKIGLLDTVSNNYRFGGERIMKMENSYGAMVTTLGSIVPFTYQFDNRLIGLNIYGNHPR